MIINTVPVGLEQRRKCTPGCGSTIPRQCRRDSVGEFLLVGPHATGLSFAGRVHHVPHRQYLRRSPDAPRRPLEDYTSISENHHPAFSNRMRNVTRTGRDADVNPGKGPADYFTGTVRIDPLFDARDPQRVLVASVTFEPGARTAWHTHPLGQTLIVTAGCGWVQRWGGPVEELRPGDVISCPPGEKHWHGATATTGMSHIAIQEQLNGKVVEWMEKVSDEQYQA